MASIQGPLGYEPNTLTTAPLRSLMLGTKTAHQALGTLGTLEILETSGVAKTPGKPRGSLVEALLKSF